MIFTQTSTFFNFSCSLKPKKPPTSTFVAATRATIAARDRVIDFGKYRGKMLGALPSTYLKWVSKNLRARNFLHWAELADQVLRDPVYKDRLEWEYAETVLGGGGNNNYYNLGTNDETTSVSQLLEISERFGWDNEDKLGWSKVNFAFLGTSKGGRIPRMPSSSSSGSDVVRGRRDLRSQENGRRVLSGSEDRRRGRRERVKSKREGEIVNGSKEKSRGGFGNLFDDGAERDGVSLRFGRRIRGESDDGDPTAEIKNPFPGRESLVKKGTSTKGPPSLSFPPPLPAENR